MAFTFANCKKYFQEALDNGYRVIPCEEYVTYKENGRGDKILVNRVDIDMSCEKAKRLASIFNDLNITASFFVRLHAEEYNPFSLENYGYLKYIRDAGHEIGYHSEVVDVSITWDEPAEECLKRDVAVLDMVLGVQVKGISSHGGMTGLNNLDFWKDKTPTDYDLLYEAYDRQPSFNLFYESFYVSDSNWTCWKCYDNGVYVPGDTRTLGEHCENGHQIIYSLIHPETHHE